DESRAAIVGQPRGLVTEQIAGYASFGPITIDRQQSHVDLETPECFLHPRIMDRISAVVDGYAVHDYDVAQISTLPLLVAFQLIVRSRNSMERYPIERERLAVIYADGPVLMAVQSLCNKGAIGFRNYELS